jgi:hypothetical protein
VLNADGSGSELLSSHQLTYFKRIKKNNEHVHDTIIQEMIGNSQVTNMFYLTKISSLGENLYKKSPLEQLEFPHNALFALKKQNN